MVKSINGDVRNLLSYNLPKFQIVIADPPWKYNRVKKTRTDGGKTAGIGACNHYKMMDKQSLFDIKVNEITDERCMLYMWATCPRLSQAIETIYQWGFEYLTVAFVWVKMNPGMWRDLKITIPNSVKELENSLDKLTFFGPGYYTGSNIELVLLGRKGKAFKHKEKHKTSQVVYSPRGDHSVKPDIVQRRIEWMYPEVQPRLELFARREISDWWTFGNELGR